MSFKLGRKVQNMVKPLKSKYRLKKKKQYKQNYQNNLQRQTKTKLVHNINKKNIKSHKKQSTKQKNFIRRNPNFVAQFSKSTRTRFNINKR